jgi:CubicO group peptidase (beta-lactamase class C family)
MHIKSIKFLIIVLFTLLLIAIPLIFSYDSSAIQDDWITSTPAEEKMDGKILNNLVEKIRNKEYGNIDSLLVVKNGKIIMEEYSNQYNKLKLHTLQSVTKSITSVLVGLAKDQGNFNNLEEILVEYFPEYKNIMGSDPRKKAITLKNALTMTAGFEWRELGVSISDSDNNIIIANNSEDVNEYVLKQPMKYEPGKMFNYNSGCPLLLSSVLKKSTGLATEKFAEEYLFKPLGIKKHLWIKSKNGLAHTGGGLFLTPRDLAKIGQLFLNNGKWNGKQVISKEWIKASTAPVVTISSSQAYGFYWWIYPSERGGVVSKDKDYIYAATGYKGQFMFVVPYKNMVVVSTADNETNSNVTIDFLYEYILKADK